MGEAPNAGEVGDPDLAAKLNKLFATMHADGKKPDSNEKVVASLAERGVRITPQYLGQIRAGKKTNVDANTLRALAEHFGVTASYLIERGPQEDIEAQLSFLRLLRDEKIRAIATRASGLSEQSLTSLRAIIDNVRELEKLPPAERDE
ncbi:helix-turn-helix domain-containing protein [Mycobacterium sp. smrl_JER01]|uniref:helix-turn-helix domain-containing protein n=1 Tax=Mycobacterium sp. smrl_JER01 TaxID=3402633 RepID=UPI003AC91EE2